MTNDDLLRLWHRAADAAAANGNVEQLQMALAEVSRLEQPVEREPHPDSLKWAVIGHRDRLGLAWWSGVLAEIEKLPPPPPVAEYWRTYRIVTDLGEPPHGGRMFLDYLQQVQAEGGIAEVYLGRVPPDFVPPAPRQPYTACEVTLTDTTVTENGVTRTHDEYRAWLSEPHLPDGRMSVEAFDDLLDQSRRARTETARS